MNKHSTSAIPETQKPDTIKDGIYKEILSLISTGRLLPDLVFTETQLIHRFCVSKAPIREALIQLCHEGVLDSMPRRGYRVLPIRPRHVTESTALRRLLELGSLPQVMNNLNQNAMQDLRDINAQRKALIKTNKDVWPLWENNVRFHLLLNSLSGNSQVYAALERALSTLTRAYAQLFALQGSVMYPDSESPARHDFVIAALEAHNMFEVYECINQDITYLQQRLLANDVL